MFLTDKEKAGTDKGKETASQDRELFSVAVESHMERMGLPGGVPEQTVLHFKVSVSHLRNVYGIIDTLQSNCTAVNRISPTSKAIRFTAAVLIPGTGLWTSRCVYVC